jgi:hypothetical protein
MSDAENLADLLQPVGAMGMRRLIGMPRSNFSKGGPFYVMPAQLNSR